MRYALVGRGRMGRAIEIEAGRRGHRKLAELGSTESGTIASGEMEELVERIAAMLPVELRHPFVQGVGPIPRSRYRVKAFARGYQAGLEAIGRDPLARIVSRAVSGVDPHLYGIGPVEAAQVALKRAGIGWDDLAVVELNEAFAAQALACLVEWPELNRAIVNPNGGAIAIGHPIGASGARIMTTLVHELARRGGGYGLATMCIGVGQGIAVVVEAS